MMSYLSDNMVRADNLNSCRRFKKQGRKPLVAIEFRPVIQKPAIHGQSHSNLSPPKPKSAG
jgi:hypothetical protein